MGEWTVSVREARRMIHPDLSNVLILPGVQRTAPDSRSLARAVERGSLIKLRRGAYVERGTWEGLDARARHLVRVDAAVSAAKERPTFSGMSAAAIWGVPILGEFPNYVTVLDRWKGGGRSEPGVRRTAAGQRTAHIEQVDGYAVTNLARTAIDVAFATPFTQAVGSVDWCIHRKNSKATSKEPLAQELRTFEGRRGIKLARSVVAFASPLSDSFGESQCRAVIHLMGFAAPQLQVEFHDSQGTMAVDFYWPAVRVAAEFDGKQKYTVAEYTGDHPEEVVWREKKRQDRLLRQIAGVERLITADVSNPARLVAILSDAGIPRSVRHGVPRGGAPHGGR